MQNPPLPFFGEERGSLHGLLKVKNDSATVKRGSVPSPFALVQRFPDQ